MVSMVSESKSDLFVFDLGTIYLLWPSVGKTPHLEVKGSKPPEADKWNPRVKTICSSRDTMAFPCTVFKWKFSF